MSTALDGAPALITGVAPEGKVAVTTELVARVVEGISVIGHAKAALESKGWRAGLAANRITVDDEVVAQYVPTAMTDYGQVGPSWTIYNVNGLPSTWIVGGGRR